MSSRRCPRAAPRPRLGRRVYEAAAQWVRAQGGRAISLGVLEHSPAAERFWRRMGFEEIGQQPYTSETGRRTSRMIVMRHALAPLSHG